jgi:asparagine synthase (glutamine-hydrolysing)
MLRTIYVICNGEIYNYGKLKRQVEYKQTYIFKSHSDIEVLLPLYKDYGINEMTKKLNG